MSNLHDDSGTHTCLSAIAYHDVSFDVSSASGLGCRTMEVRLDRLGSVRGNQLMPMIFQGRLGRIPWAWNKHDMLGLLDKLAKLSFSPCDFTYH